MRVSAIVYLQQTASHVYSLSRVVKGNPDAPCTAGSDGIDSVPDKEQVLLKDCEAEDGDRDVSSCSRCVL